MTRNGWLRSSRIAGSATVFFLLCSVCLVNIAHAAPAATTTMLVLSSGGEPVTTVASGADVALTATVKTVVAAPGMPAPVVPGTVIFCDSSAPPTSTTTCTGLAVVGTAQLTGTGTAAIHLVPGIGAHHYFAVFVGTTGATASNTSALALTVTGLYPTSTTIAATGTAGNYSLTATVSGTVPSVNVVAVPSGTVSFNNTSNMPTNNVTTATLAAGANPPTPPTQSFPAQTPALAPGTAPGSIAVGDFNGDGIPDLAVATVGTDPTKPGSVSIFLGTVGGIYPAAPNQTYTVGRDPVSIAVGDFNGDGFLDLVVVNANDSTVSILLGAGNGTFAVEAAAPSTVDAGTSVAAGDLNNDGILDLAVSTAGGVAVLLGTGTPTLFGTADVYAAGTSFQSVAIGDFNGDGLPDLAAVSDTNTPGTLAILINVGGGAFPPTTPTHSYTVGAKPASVAVGGFKTGVILDLAVANSADGTVSILLGNGDGTFTATAASPYPTGKGPNSVVVGDLNGAGFADLAIANLTDGTVSILIGNGTGAFTAPTTSPYMTGNGPLAVAAGDFNGDGLADLATANSTAGTVSLLLNTLTQTATATATPVAVTGPATPMQNIEASYPGDTEDDPQLYGPSVSATTPLTGAPIPASLSLSTMPVANSVYGQSVTLTATLTPDTSQGLTADGNVTFTGATLGTEMLVAGTATFGPIATLPVGTYNLSATYANDPNFAAPPATPVPFTVGKATPVVTIGPANPLASTYGANITYTFTVTGPTGVTQPAGGTVTFLDGGTAIAACTNLALSAGSCTVATLSVTGSPHTITATYNGTDPNYVTPTTSSNTLSQTINKATPVVTIGPANPPASNYGANITYTFTVTGPTGVTQPAGGTVTFLDGGTAIAACTNLALSAGSCTVATLSVPGSPHTITAAYNGTDTNYVTPTSSNTLSQTIHKATPVVTIGPANPPASNYGANIIYTFTVTGPTGVTQPAGGTVTFLDGGTAIASCTNLALSAGSCTVATLSVAAHMITATYNGTDTNYVTPTTSSNTLSQTINKATPVVTMPSITPALTPPATAYPYGTSLTFNVVVSGSSGTGVMQPTGSVTFNDIANGGAPVCTTPVLNSQGAASCTISVFSLNPVGTHQIVANYNILASDPNYLPAQPSAATPVIVAKDTPKVTLTVGGVPTSSTSNLGDPVTFTVTVANSITNALGPALPTGMVAFLDGNNALAMHGRDNRCVNSHPGSR